MAIRILEIAPKITPPPSDPVQAHLSIQRFAWVNEQDLKKGESSLATMFDWIVNKKGVAYVKTGDSTIPVYGAVSPTGQQYIRCIKDNKWSDELLDLPQIAG
jgi:hypothetical protein